MSLLSFVSFPLQRCLHRFRAVRMFKSYAAQLTVDYIKSDNIHLMNLSERDKIISDEEN